MTTGNRVAILRQKFAASIGLPFAEILSESEIEHALKNCGVTYRKRLFCPIVTLWAWLSQVLDPDKSCKKAVSRVISYLVAAGQTPPSTDTGAYCKARARLTEKFLLGLMRLTGKHSHEQSEPERLWCGRRVKVFDGSSMTMADTTKNQQKYPQPTSQAKGCGFPAGRIVCGFSLSTGAVVDAVISSLAVGEVNLFRQLFVHLQVGDVALGDRIFGTFADICLLFARGVDSAFRVHGARKTDFTLGKRLARWDHIVEWVKPKQCPKGLKRQLKHLKTTMAMEHLPSKMPEMVRKDFYVHLLAYNLIRTMQLEASRQHCVDPLALSFCAVIQHLSSFTCLLAHATLEQRTYQYEQLIYLVSTEKLPFRPNRVEPRVVKRRPKKYPRLSLPREQLRGKCQNRTIDPKTRKASPTY